MWIHTFFKSLNSTSTCRRPIRRRPPTSRPRLDVLEDRCLPSFYIGGDYTYPNTPQEVVAADFNGDGHPDVAIPGRVLLANADGTFGAGQAFPTDGITRSMAAGDFNGDGKIDLAMANEFRRPTVLFGNGDGTMQGPYQVPLMEPGVGGGIAYFNSYYALDVAVADANADGKPDLLFSGLAQWVSTSDSTELGGYVSASLGQGDGTFFPAYGALVGSEWDSAAGDLNADGKIDIVYGAEVRYGSGDGTFAVGTFFTPDLTGGTYVTVADFNGDGKTDRAAAGDPSDRISGGNVVLSNGDGTFQPPLGYSSGASQRALASADFNGDGRMDLVTAHWGGQGAVGFLTVCLGNGNGTFQAALSFPASPIGFSQMDLTLSDFNGDGRMDVAVKDGGERGNLRVLLNDGDWPLPAPQSVTISDVTVTEGNTGTRAATFTVTLSAASSQPVTVAYSTANGTAIGSDYQAASGTLTIPAGQTTGTITVLVNGDRLAEANGTFFVNLSGATIADGQGVGTIVDDEPRISIGDVSKLEGRNGKTKFTFTVTLSAVYDQAVTTSFATANGTATTGDNDYIAKTGTLTFAPGETTKTVTIEVKGDSKKEADEYFFLDLFGNSGNALFTKSRGLGTILNDD